jgi:hypothetical protein
LSHGNHFARSSAVQAINSSREICKLIAEFSHYSVPNHPCGREKMGD